MKKILLIATLFLGLNLQNENAQPLMKMSQTTEPNKVGKNKNSISTNDSILSKKIKTKLESYEKLVSEESQKVPTFSLRDNIDESNKKTYYIQSGEFYEKISNIPFLNTERIISFNRDNSKYLRKTNKKYIKLMEAVVAARNEKELNKANKKALDFFNNFAYAMTESEAKFYGVHLQEILVANYQLGHYYAFGIFDPYFDGARPSNIERNGLNPIDKDKAHKYFKQIKNEYAKGLIQLIPNTWYYNIKEGVASAGNMENHKELAEIIRYLDENNHYFNPYLACKLNSDYCDYCESNAILPLNIVKILYAIEQLPKNSSIRKQLSLDLTTDEIIALALSYEKELKIFDAMYYGALAAVRGNINGYIIMVNQWSKSLLSHYKNNHSEYYNAGIAHQIIPIRLWLIENCLNDCEINNLEEISEKIEAYYIDMADEFYSDYTAQKKAQRREKWRQLGMAFATAMQQTSMQTTNSYSNLNYNNIGDFNSLIDPRFAAMQVNTQYHTEYQDFCRYNKKEDGNNYTYGEWLAIRGQAIQNLKDQGYDIIAENRKEIEQQKSDYAAQREEDKKAWFAKYGYDTSSLPTQSSSEKTSTVTDNTDKTSQDSDIKVSNLNIEENIDSKEQYKSNSVSSDDYYFEKHVTLYIREANRNKIMFSNKDLYKKGANYYVKIDNTYYLVNVQGGWGFNSSILYAHNKLYFNK